jgi:long-subunit fatty acid transport protein
MRRILIFTTALLCLLATQAYAQFPEDALRLALPGIGVGSRALGMGNAYTGVASDYSAIYWNPAGLAQAEHGEFSLGLSYLNNQDKSSLGNQDNTAVFGIQTPYTNTLTNLNSLGFVYPVPVRKGSLVFAFGFDRQSNFTSGISFSGFNPNSSIIQNTAPDGGIAPSDLSGNLAYQLYLANLDTLTNRFVSPIKNRVTQKGVVTEEGGLNNWSVAGAMDIARNFSAGVTLTYLSGTYHYDRTYTEEDLNGIYQTFPFDFQRLTLRDNIDSDISGFNAKFGFMYRVPDRFRFAVAVRTPTVFNVRESFGTTASSYFDNGDVQPADGPFKTTGDDEYDVHTPWVFSVGTSVILNELVLAADVDFTDWTSLSFANANPDVMAENQDIKTLFRSVFDYRVGAEYELPAIGVRLRGGYMVNRSPYAGDPSDFDQRFVTGGVGIPFGASTMLDLTFAHGWWITYRVNYDATSRVNENVATNNFLATFVYRF